MPLLQLHIKTYSIQYQFKLRRYSDSVLDRVQKGALQYEKSIIIPLAAVLCLSLLTGCNAKDSSTPPDSQQTNPPAQATVASANISDTSEAYEKLVALKTEDYKQQSVADFNQSLAPNNGDISGLLDAQAEVLASISPDDENYEFITMTLAASLDELYCEQMNDSVGLSAYLKREERPLEKLPGEESVAGAEITYQFVLMLYTD